MVYARRVITEGTLDRRQLRLVDHPQVKQCPRQPLSGRQVGIEKRQQSTAVPYFENTVSLFSGGGLGFFLQVSQGTSEEVTRYSHDSDWSCVGVEVCVSPTESLCES